jgi:heat shock protein HslJ
MSALHENGKWILVVGVVALVLLAISLASRNSKVVMAPEQSQAEKTTNLVETVTGYYVSEMPSASGPGIVSLDLASDMKATFTQDYQNGKPAIVESGTWEVTTDKMVLVTLDKRGTVVMLDPEVMKYIYDEKAETLTLTDYDKSVWGEEGLVLQRSFNLTDTSWSWIVTEMSDDTRTETDANASYSITFNADGTLPITTDCNSAQARYTTSGVNSLTILPGAMTRMYCQGSVDTLFVQQLAQADSYKVEGDTLTIMLKMDSGTMTFVKRESGQ